MVFIIGTRCMGVPHQPWDHKRSHDNQQRSNSQHIGRKTPRPQHQSFYKSWQPWWAPCHTPHQEDIHWPRLNISIQQSTNKLFKTYTFCKWLFPLRSQGMLIIGAGESSFIHELANNIVTVIRDTRADASKVWSFFCIKSLFNYGCKYQFIGTLSILPI